MSKSQTVALKAGDTTYNLRFTTAAMVKYEEETGLPFMGVAELFNDPDGKPKNPTIRAIRQLLLCGLIDSHEHITERECNSILDEVGVVPVALKIGAAIDVAFPEANRGKATTKGNESAPVGKTAGAA